MWKSDYKIGLINVEKCSKMKDASIIRVWMDRETFRELLKASMSAVEQSKCYPELLPWCKITESLDDLDTLIIDALADE